MEGQRRIEQRVLQVFPTWVPRIAEAKVIIEEEVETTRRVILNPDLEDSDYDTDPAVITVQVTAVLGMVQNPPWHPARSVKEDIQDLE